MTTLFVYGTLIHPHILSRVLAGTLHYPNTSGDDPTPRFSRLSVQPAILPNYDLFRVRDQEYPALAAQSLKQQGQSPSVVRGVVIHGLTPADLQALDLFEGDEYRREDIEVIVPTSEDPVSNDVRSSWAAETIQNILDSSLPPQRVKALLQGAEAGERRTVQGYVWVAPASYLEGSEGPRGLWLFSTFARSKSRRWISEEWTDPGGPDGVVELQGATPPETPAIPALEIESGGTGGFDEVRRSMTDGTDGSTPAFGSASAFSGLSLAAGEDPWADRTSATARITPSATEISNPWGQAGPAEDPSTGAGHSTALSREEIPEGYPLELGGREAPGFETFGKPISRWFFHGVQQGGGASATTRRRYLNFNNGSLGSCPKPVFEAYQDCALKAEENPDLFARTTVPQALAGIRARVAKLLNCPPSTLAIVTNSTTGSNAVVRGFPWQKGDHVVALSPFYGALEKTFQYVQDTSATGAPNLVKIEIVYPMEHEEIVEKFREKVRTLKRDGVRVRMGVFDAISSLPGVLTPWEELVKVCREEEIYSLVDGAHTFCHIDLDLGKARPDFFVTNCHKWGYTHRTNALLYIPLENQHLIPSGLPTSWFYRTKEERHRVKEEEKGHDFGAQWEYPGTIDYSSFLSLNAALDFRARIGGEARIRTYTHSLALLGGLSIARALGSELLETVRPSLTAAMCNVRLPLASRVVGTDPTDWLAQKGTKWLSDRLLDEYNTALRFFVYNRTVFTRVSAQIWLDLDDFDYLGKALKDLCRRINAGEGP